jgi:CMP-N-acetylneuraminic acid synthetase
MIENKRVLALVPARSGSKGLPKKNILNICDAIKEYFKISVIKC